ncbi:nuclease s1 [Xylariaceae sp. FL0804]|nr:nuclease s1 [Xylariaceae sp. FL0804]
MTSYLPALAFLAAPHGAQAWGSLGHATVAYIAQNYVSSSTASWAKGILDDTSDSYLANIASWADDYRETTAGEWSAALHFIDAEDDPPTTCDVDYDRDCGSEGCSVSAIANYTQRVGDGRLSDTNVNQALKFLVHFLGDVTQPLHDEALELGGNGIDVTFEGYSDNLHSDWDTYMPEKLVGGYALTDAQSWANDLISSIDSGDYKSLAADWIDGDDISDAITTATRWAADANAYVCTVVMPDGQAALEDADDLYPDYYNSAIGTIELQIAKAGYRLANWLDMIYTQNVAKRSVEERALDEEPADLSGREFLPEPRPLSKAKLARAAVGYGCGHAHHRH